MSHTPGPWHVNIRDFRMVSAANGNVAACMYGTRLEAEANARLIAATLDLLDAARKALNFCLNTQSELGIEPESEYEMDTTKILRAAIAKATGA